MNLDTLVAAAIDTRCFNSVIARLQRLFDSYSSTCPTPFISPGLIVTPEIRIQSELYIPAADIAAAFNLLYSAALTYPPILSSTPFYQAMSWADIFTELPPKMQFSVNPARLLETLLADKNLMTEFLFASFLPRRFYGGYNRYPGQRKCLREWLKSGRAGSIRCLDAACGTGDGTHELALTLSESGFAPEDILIEGWTVEPLEVWTAIHRLPHRDRLSEAPPENCYAAPVEREYHSRITFHCRNILEVPYNDCYGRMNEIDGSFDLILCNGLLGGPIINQRAQLSLAVNNLVQLLSPGGILLAADSFHGGWKQRCPQTDLQALLEVGGLTLIESGEGIGGLKPY